MRVEYLEAPLAVAFHNGTCNCGNCRGVRDGTIRTRARTQSSIAASGDGQRWVLFNASPDILQQIREFAALQPGDRLRTTAIAAIVLIDAQIDHTTGLLMLREHDKPLELWCTEPVFQDLTTGNPVAEGAGAFRRRAPPSAAAFGRRIPDPRHRRLAVRGLRTEQQGASVLAPPRPPAAGATTSA